MAVYEVKKVNVFSLVKSVPVIFLLLGSIIGLFTFFFFPTELAITLSFGQKLLSWLIFVVLYTLIMSVGVMLVAWLYNVVVTGLGMGGLSLTLEPKDNM